METYIVRPSKSSDLDTVYQLEVANYPPDEAATREKLEYRLHTAAHLFYVLEKYTHSISSLSVTTLSTSTSSSSLTSTSEIIGFICGTQGKGNDLQEHFMSVGGHDPDGESICIHSVVIDSMYQRKYLGIYLVQRFLQYLYQKIVLQQHQQSSSLKQIKQCLLLAHQDKLGLYNKAGFITKGPSKVIHGAEQWIEMVYSFSFNHHANICNNHVNAFTICTVPKTESTSSVPGKLYSGNPAAVVVLPPYYNSSITNITDGYPSDDWCQLLAQENNLSETAFLLPRYDGTFTIRWWTPGQEVTLCGHATLASAKILFNEQYVPLLQSTLILHSRSGILYATKEIDNHIQLNFPVEAPLSIDNTPTEYTNLQTTLCAAFHINTTDILYIGKNAWDLILEIKPIAFTNLTTTLPINYELLSTIDCRGVAVTCKGNIEISSLHYDNDNPPSLTSFTNLSSPFGHFFSRWFGPRVAVLEDPVTGSAHCALYPYWENKLSSSSSTVSSSPWLLAYQASSRGGHLWLHRKNNRIYLRGQAQITSTSYLTINVVNNKILI